MASAGVAGDADLIFVVSAGFFAAGLIGTARLSDTHTPVRARDRVGSAPDSAKTVVLKHKSLFLALFLRNVSLAAVLVVMPIVLVEQMGAGFWQISVMYGSSMAVMFAMMSMMSYRIKLSTLTEFTMGRACRRLPSSG